MAGLQKLNVLVVDADEQTPRAVESFLSGEHYRVVGCGRPERAVDQLKRGRYPLVLLDLGQDDATGLALLERMRAADSDVCVITMTARPSVESAVAAMKRGGSDYLRKPFKLDELRRVVEDAVHENGLFVDPEARLNAAVGQRIRERRIERSLTLKQLANRTGLSVSLISQIELGKSAASVSTLHKLARALSVRMGYFFDDV